MAPKSTRIDPLILPPFHGFGPDAFAFLRELAAHQDRDWFAQHRERYETQARRPMIALLIALQEALKARKVSLKGDPVASVFRINRDVRFSKDKSPYKTNLSAALTRSGARDDAGVLYIQLAADACFAAAGFYNPPGDVLHAIRNTIAKNPPGFRVVVKQLAEAGLVLDPSNCLTRLPQGFPGRLPGRHR